MRKLNIERLTDELQFFLFKKDPNDERSSFLRKSRAGAGGDEAGIFAGNMLQPSVLTIAEKKAGALK